MTSFKRALLASLLLHVLIVGTYCFLSQYEPPIKLDHTSIQVSLSKLGQKRDENLLPRFDAGKKPTPKKTKNPLDILKKRFGTPDLSGNPEGSVFGKSINSELANSYELQVIELLRDNYEIPRVITDREAARLKLFVRLWISPNGNLLNIKIQKASQNKRFDDAVLYGSRRISSFGAPPITLARKYKTEGLLIEFCPLECS